MEPNTVTSRSMPRRLVLPASALIALCAFVHACGGGGGGGGGSTSNPPSPPPPTSFVSTSQLPGNSATNVSCLPVVLIGFNDFVDQATMNSTTVQLLQGAVPVASALTYIPCTNQVQLIPSSALNPGMVYTVSLTSGLQDDDGEGLVAITRTFTTTGVVDTVRPTFTVAGYTAVPNPGFETTEVFLDWDDATDPPNTPAQIGYFVYFSAQPACFNYANPAMFVPPGAPTEAIITGLNPRTAYSFVVRAMDPGQNVSLNTNQLDVTTFTSLVTNVFPIVQNLCVSCHIPPNGQAVLAGVNMNYSTAQTVFNSWVGQTSFCATANGAPPNAFGTRVVAGAPLDSFLWNKISTQDNTGTPQGTPVCGSQMPLGQPTLSAANQDIIFDWITQGAINN
jgi:hypothetical protein